MMNSLAHLLTSSQQQDRGALAEGIQSLNQGMQSWLGGMKERHQKRTTEAAAKLIQQDKIPWDEVNELLADVDIDPVAMMQGLEPVIANQKRQQFQRVGPIISEIISTALSAGEKIPMGKIMTVGTQQGLGFGETLAVLKGLQDVGLIPTTGQKLEREKFEAGQFQKERDYLSGLSVGTPLKDQETAQHYTDVTGIPYQTQPGATSQALMAHQRPQQPGMPTPTGQGPTISALGHRQNLLEKGYSEQEQHFTGGVPQALKSPTSEAGIAARDFPLWEKMQRTKQKYSATSTSPSQQIAKRKLNILLRLDKGESLSAMELSSIGISSELVPYIGKAFTSLQNNFDFMRQQDPDVIVNMVLDLAEKYKEEINRRGGVTTKPSTDTVAPDWRTIKPLGQ